MSGNWDFTPDKSVSIDAEPHLLEISEYAPPVPDLVLGAGLKHGSKVISDVEVCNRRVMIFEKDCIGNARSHIRLKGPPSSNPV